MLQKATKALSILTVLFFLAVAVSVRSSAQTVKSQIQRMSGWESCTTCAGINANGPQATITTFAGNSSPSLSGDSRMFYLASSAPYADALWWKQLGSANWATNLRYDLDFYLQTPQDAQALEFDTNQANGQMRWIFGTECNIVSGRWDVWGNAAGNWMPTGIPCAMPTPYKWHHLTWEFKRNGGWVTYVAVTLDGVKHYLNWSFPARRSGSNELNVTLQMDNRANHVAFKTWLDNVTLTYW